MPLHAGGKKKKSCPSCHRFSSRAFHQAPVSLDVPSPSRNRLPVRAAPCISYPPARPPPTPLPPTRSTTQAPQVHPSNGSRFVPLAELIFSWNCPVHLFTCLPSASPHGKERTREAGRPRIRPPWPLALSPRVSERLSTFWLRRPFQIHLSPSLPRTVASFSVVCINHASVGGVYIDTRSCFFLGFLLKKEKI